MGEATPTTIDGFTPGWLTEALRRSDTIDSSTTVTDVDRTILGTGEGFMGELARLTLTYDGAPGPATMIAKIPTQVEQNRALGKSLGIYEREVRVYADLLPTIDIPTPRVHAAVYEATGEEADLVAQTYKGERLPIWLLRLILRRQATDADVPPCVLVVEDLGVDAEVGDQVAGLSPASTEDGLRVLARLHASTWNDVGVPDTHWVLRLGRLPRLFHAIYLRGRKRCVEVLDGDLSDHTLSLLSKVRRGAVRRVRTFYERTPSCLLHGDYRPDNLFFDETGAVQSVIDWQSVGTGPAVFDVSYFVISSLAADVPESEIDRLLAAYHEELVANGVTGYSLDQLRADYDESLIIGVHRMPLLVDNVDFGDGRGQELIEQAARRFDARLRRVSI